ncbi:MAG: nucleoside phosphorylase [Candidatus Ventricola sp.]
MINDFYDVDSEPIVKLEAFYGPKKNLLEKCLIIFSKYIYEHLLQQYECEQIAIIRACNGNIPVWSFTYKEQQIAFYLTPIGSALAGGSLVEVNHLTGAKKFIMFGSCGSLDNSKTDGKFIIPTQAYRGEGFSYYFAEPRNYIDIRNAGQIADIFSSLNIPYVQGRVWTTDCMLRETVNLVTKRKREGCIAVEMELAGVQAVCDFYGFELFDFLAAGDVLTVGDYDVSRLSDANHNLDKLQIALHIAERI